MATASVTDTPKNEDSARGFLFALVAYLMWGFLPIYMKAVAHIPAAEVLAHRVVWSVPFAGIVLLLLGRTRDLVAALRSPRMLLMASLTAAIISVNWAIYIWAIAAGHAIDAALGYFINPLFSIFLAAVILKERILPVQMVAIALAAIAVCILTYDAGGLPWVALSLTVTWGFYALFRKTLPVGPNQGFFLEVAILFIPALAYVIYLEATGNGHLFTTGTSDSLLLIAAGAITATPLMVYANGAKLLKLSTIGIMQYIAPTMIFLIAVFVFQEPLNSTKLVAFVFIWAALAVYSWSLLRAARKG